MGEGKHIELNKMCSLDGQAVLDEPGNYRKLIVEHLFF